MSGYYCRDCDAIKPLFLARPHLAWRSRALGRCPSTPSWPVTATAGSLSRTCPTPRWPRARARGAATAGQPRSKEPLDEVPLRPVRQPMKLQTVSPPERGSLSVVYSCPECGYEIAMLTNALRDAGRPVARRARSARPRRRRPAEASAEAGTSGGKCPFSAMIPAATRDGRHPAAPMPVRWTAGARAQAREHPEFVRPMARTRHREVRRASRATREIDETRAGRAPRDASSGCERSAVDDRSPHGFARPYVVSWNLTYRCNLACEHCYLDAGRRPRSAPRPSPTAASSTPRSASRSSTRSPPSPPSA